MTKVLNHKQVANLIKSIGDKRTVIVEGEFGIGKTSILWEFKKDPAFNNYMINDPIDCTQMSDGSLFMPDIDREKGVSRELPNERFGVHRGNQKGVDGARPVIMCFDEVGKAKQFVKDAIAAPLYERRIGQYHMVEGSIAFGCTNLSDEGLGDTMFAHLRNRVVVVRMRKPTQEEWMNDFAIPNRLSAEVIACTMQLPKCFDSYLDYHTGGKFSGRDIKKDNPWISNPHDASQEQVVTPRSLHAASDILLAGGTDDDTLQCALDGVVGESFGAELMSYVRFGRDIPAFTRVVQDPAGCPLSKSPVGQIVQVMQFITNVRTREEVASVVEYAKRMNSEMQSLLISTVANSSGTLGLWCGNKMFGEMLTEHRKFFSM